MTDPAGETLPGFLYAAGEKLEVTGGADAGKWRKRRCKEVSDSGKGV